MTKSSAVYSSLEAAAIGLLGEAVTIAGDCGIDFVTCGGWSPFLRNSGSIQHPGSKDVDLLFSEGADKESLADVVSAFLARGYLVSAKCRFQVLRVLSVAGTEFVFNVDMLHPHEGTLAGEFCVDQLSLPIPFKDFDSTFIFQKSIALANSGFVFDGYREMESLDVLLPDSSQSTCRFPLIDEVGLIATKSQCCILQSRPRDLFDIFLAVKYPRCEKRFKRQLSRLRRDHPTVYASLEFIGKAVDEWEGRLNVPEVYKECGVDFSEAMSTIRSFLKDLDFAGKG